ncbi:MAG: SCP2 sterol-binding domain-containing protein, partial [Lachnospiraceae bacterium]|nr:SCP2 sterol-binding domain-containing protein [Lachnospiraceae bacterium]
MLECKEEYDRLIEKKAENMYRTINQKLTSFPASNQAVKQKVSYTQNIALTPQETEQLSLYASDDNYVQRQKEDIKELTNMFKDMMENRETDEKQSFIEDFMKCFTPQPGFNAIFRIVIKNYAKPMILRIQNAKFECFYGTSEYADVELQTEENVIIDVVAGKTTFQNAFMNGNMTMKGDFKLLRNLDHIFPFSGTVTDDGMFV